MMPLSADDMRLRLRRMLPARWWADEAPVLDGLLLGLGSALAAIHGLIAYARQQTRLATAAAPWLDLAAQDFLGGRLQRRPQEADDAFRGRLLATMQRPRATRDAVEQAVLRVTGGKPQMIFEPRRAADTGAWNLGCLGYGVAGGWGSLGLPAQVFVAVERPRGTGCALLAGYGTGGIVTYAGLAQIGAQVPDAEIFAAIADAMPSGAVAWTRLN
jgi:hypothetical protein